MSNGEALKQRSKGAFTLESYHYLIELSIILISTKVLGILTKKFAMPQVVGALIAGLVMGPACLGILHETDLLDTLAELGVIVLMFDAGLGTDLDELKRSGKAAFVIALIGVLVPLGGGFLLGSVFSPGQTLQNMFLGVVLTATSVSITVETLRELGKLSTRSGNAILGAALIDDVLGIIALTMITSMAGQGASIGMVLLKIVAFFVISAVAGYAAYRAFNWWFARYDRDKKRFVIVALAACLFYSYIAETYFGVADITGAYIAGVIFAKTPRVAYLQYRFETLSYMLLSPVFFASIGIKVDLSSLGGSMILFALLLLLVAILSKIAGCGIGAKLCGYTNEESLRIGCGMISRGEVALIVANKGISSGLMNQDFFAPVVLVVIATTILTPILLKFAYQSSKGQQKEHLEESPLLDRIEDVKQLDLVSQSVLEAHEKLRQESREKQEHSSH